MSVSAPATIVFDSSCLLCDGWVRFLLRVDTKARYRFAAMQGQTGRSLLMAHGLDPEDPLSFLLKDGDGVCPDSNAILRVLSGLGGVWRLSAMGWLLPRPLRDAAYRQVARNRYRWFGQKAQCLLPVPDQAARFLS